MWYYQSLRECGREWSMLWCGVWHGGVVAYAIWGQVVDQFVQTTQVGAIRSIPTWDRLSGCVVCPKRFALEWPEPRPSWKPFLVYFPSLRRVTLWSNCGGIGQGKASQIIITSTDRCERCHHTTSQFWGEYFILSSLRYSSASVLRCVSNDWIRTIRTNATKRSE